MVNPIFIILSGALVASLIMIAIWYRVRATSSVEPKIDLEPRKEILVCDPQMTWCGIYDCSNLGVDCTEIDHFKSIYLRSHDPKNIDDKYFYVAGNFQKYIQKAMAANSTNDVESLFNAMYTDLQHVKNKCIDLDKQSRNQTLACIFFPIEQPGLNGPNAFYAVIRNTISTQLNQNVREAMLIKLKNEVKVKGTRGMPVERVMLLQGLKDANSGKSTDVVVLTKIKQQLMGIV